jgi:hypothetical protein
VAGHPLRPATRRRLGRPSPHQQADRPRAHPTPLKTFHPKTCISESYPVLDPVSQAYPEVQGRSPTCYSPVRHSSTPKGAFPFDLHVLSTPPAFVLSQDQTLQTKTPGQSPAEFESEQSDLTKRHQKTGIKKTDHTLTRGAKMQPKKTTTKTKPPNTLLSSQTTPSGRATSPRLIAAYSWCGRRETHRSGTSLWDIAALDGLGRVATTRSSYASANAESNSLLDAVFELRKINEHARPRRYSACPAARPASVHAGSRPVAVPTLRRRPWCC